MNSISLYPNKAYFHPGEQAEVVLSWQGLGISASTLTYRIFHGENIIYSQTEDVPDKNSYDGKYNLYFSLPGEHHTGYGMIVTFEDSFGKVLGQASTAFDVLSDWTVWPRYGFMTNFSPNRNKHEIEHSINILSEFHINGLQFYDWQYRHDEFIAPVEEYLDPLGRKLSLSTVRALIQAAHEKNMAAMPYTAAYAASAEYWKANPHMAMYDKEGKTIAFGDDFLGIMDPTRGKSWSKHLLQQFNDLLKKMDFDGIHIDQYGEPKTGFNAKGEAIDIPKSFVDLISDTHRLIGKPTTLFNAVGNWPIDHLATSDVAFPYIEIWPPDMTYKVMVNILSNAKHLSGGKPVVLAQYIPAGHPANVITASTVAMACGCSRIELGEDGRLLSDPYYPKHEELPEELKRQLKLHYDFWVRFGEWIERTNAVEEISEPMPGILLRMVRGDHGVVINIVNMPENGLSEKWNIQHKEVQKMEKVTLHLELNHTPTAVYFATPDEPINGLLIIAFEYKQGAIKFELPEINHWGLVDIRYE
ncbi:MAG: hypothetical protein C0391_08785 [Anaerolinea sp.]|nr:hypothetical protein [Anaerolinea sp.]